jgi:hypothetical protein
MKKIWLPLMVLLLTFGLLGLLFVNRGAEAAKAAGSGKSTKATCKTCHADFTDVIPNGHPPVKGNDLKACTSSHSPDQTGKAEKNAFSARMHLAHVAPNGNEDCLACHTWKPGKSFGLNGIKGSFGAPKKEDVTMMKEIFSSWGGSKFMDNLHAKGSIGCAGCHGKGLPKADDTVENNRCLTCHGPMEKLVQKTEPKDFKDRNPHKSHLGDMACTVCHKAHAASKVYCLDCHKKFDMKIKGAAN